MSYGQQISVLGSGNPGIEVSPSGFLCERGQDTPLARQDFQAEKADVLPLLFPFMDLVRSAPGIRS